MTDYNESTQKKFWIFTKTEFDQIRQENHDRIIKLLIQDNYNKEHSAESVDLSSTNSSINQDVSTPPRNNTSPTQSTENSTNIEITQEMIDKYISVEEEWVLLSNYLIKVFDIYPKYCKRTIDYRTIQYIVCSYVKRFFMKRSILQYNPKLICAGAYMLALKVDEYPPIHAKILAELFKEDKDEIISAEQKILFGINYEIIIHTPQPMFVVCIRVATHLQLLDTVAKKLVKKEKWKQEVAPMMNEIYSKTEAFLIQVYITELEFLFPPSSILLFVYYSVLNGYPFGKEFFKDVFTEVCHFDADMKVSSEEDAFDKVMKSIEEVAKMYRMIEKRMKSMDPQQINKKWKRDRTYEMKRSKPKDVPSSSQSVSSELPPPQSEKRPHPETVYCVC